MLIVGCKHTSAAALVIFYCYTEFLFASKQSHKHHYTVMMGFVIHVLFVVFYNVKYFAVFVNFLELTLNVLNVNNVLNVDYSTLVCSEMTCILY